ncbi:MAG TPA: hypothetical protein VEB21_18035, partial [Terriglobales bacterium]|nr:hypothetical protein [Terriglobales bacterium]
MSRSHSRWLAAFVVFVLALLAILDQSLKSIWVTRPVAEIGQMIEITGGDAAPYYRLRAGADTHYTRWRNPDAVTRVRINALGMRGDEYNLERRPGVQRIVAIGDSMTFGIAVEAEEALPAQLEKLLRQRGHDVEVWNAGTPGHQMEDYLGTLRRILPLAQPDVVVLGLTGGDEVAPYPISNTLL